MIVSFDKEIAEIRAAIAAGKSDMDIAMILAMVLDAGLGMERQKNIQIVQRMAVNPMPIVEAMRKAQR